MDKIKEIRLLSADEVELRPGRFIKDKKNNTIACSLLAYKDARVDMRILDEVFGWNNWERRHELMGGQLFCTVSVFDSEKGAWISKQDVGTESNTEAEKGRASDSFKRACFNFGIGRELYDAPFIYIPLANDEYVECDGKYQLRKVRFKIQEMKYEKALGQFSIFTVVDQYGKVRFALPKTQKLTEEKKQEESQKQVDKGADDRNMFVDDDLPKKVKKPDDNTTQTQNKYTCSNCGRAISDNVFDFSLKKFRQPLCMNCQKEFKNK